MSDNELTPEQRGRNRGKLWDQSEDLLKEVNSLCYYAHVFYTTRNTADFELSSDEIQQSFRRIEYRLNKIKQLWKEC